MFSVAREIVFQASHYLCQNDGRSEQPHRHDWRVRATIQAEKLDCNGFVIDFLLLEKLLHQVVEPLRQIGQINQLREFTRKNPSTEHLAEYIYGRLATMLPEGVYLQEVIVWETPQCRAVFRP